MQESRLSIGVADPEDSTDLRDFYRWLGDEEEAPGTIRLASEPVAGSMSGGLDVIDVVLTHAVGLANLTVAYATWRKARRSRAALTFTRASDGLTVTVEEGSEEAVQQLLRAFSEPGRPEDG
ncbi:effector-associated constant component EACC1 [Streptomyces exfoliatus]|uniref:effector-associated constant component EACC1 n=1 Tax=Streptomyces exfoliatus TaxID=1905 RepID=UPI0006892ECC|nr:hypothetical protein [Streptomyces exfoliatus]